MSNTSHQGGRVTALLQPFCIIYCFCHSVGPCRQGFRGSAFFSHFYSIPAHIKVEIRDFLRMLASSCFQWEISLGLFAKRKLHVSYPSRTRSYSPFQMLKRVIYLFIWGMKLELPCNSALKSCQEKFQFKNIIYCSSCYERKYFAEKRLSPWVAN